MRSYFWSVFSCIRTENGDLWSISPYSVRIQENTDQKQLRIWTLFTHLESTNQLGQDSFLRTVFAMPASSANSFCCLLIDSSIMAQSWSQGSQIVGKNDYSIYHGNLSKKKSFRNSKLNLVLRYFRQFHLKKLHIAK